MGRSYVNHRQTLAQRKWYRIKKAEKWQSKISVRQSETAHMTHAGPCTNACEFILVTSRRGRMPPLSPEDKAFVVAQYYAGKTATQIQRKFKRDHGKIFCHKTINRWLKRVPAEFEKNCTMNRKVRETLSDRQFFVFSPFPVSWCPLRIHVWATCWWSCDRKLFRGHVWTSVESGSQFPSIILRDDERLVLRW